MQYTFTDASPTSSRMKQQLKTLASRVAPEAFVAISAVRARRYSHRLVKQWGLYDLNQRLIREIGNRVVAGPFEGMILSRSAQLEHIGPYLLGTYEMELHPWLNQLFHGEFSQIIDIGANFGYYAVGLARRFPSATSVAFDADWWARRTVREMASANGVDGVSVKGLCSASWLDANLRENALIVSDCEGYEQQLFGTRWVPAFASATLIIELHEAVAPGVGANIAAKFASTHVVQEIASRSEAAAGFQSKTLTSEEMLRVSHEVRSKQTWILLTPKGRG
jgi:precorrin-6B methylase 2